MIAMCRLEMPSIGVRLVVVARLLFFGALLLLLLLLLLICGPVMGVRVSGLSIASSSSPPPIAPHMKSVTTTFPYDIPPWAKQFLTKSHPKAGRLKLGNLPTPIHGISPQQTNRFQEYALLRILHEVNMTILIKRDDMTGGPELGGNKIRKLEFLLADALDKNCDSVVTIGGVQSNHCRATACAARLIGIEPHLILRHTAKKKSTTTTTTTKSQDPSSISTSPNEQHYKDDQSLGLKGNIMFDRIVGSAIHTCTSGEYGRFGSVALVEMLCSSLRGRQEHKRNPYPIPVGGSNALGTWGYIEAVNELSTQLPPEQQLDYVVVATGSGGTLAGITMGLELYYHSQKLHSPVVHAVGVCDNPEYFYKKLEQIREDMGYTMRNELNNNNIRDNVKIHQGKGVGYALSTTEEIEFIKQFAQSTGIALDPVYTGKALYHFVNVVVKQSPEQFRNSQVLFWHTGGSLGLQVCEDELMTSLKQSSPVTKLNVYKQN